MILYSSHYEKSLVYEGSSISLWDAILDTLNALAQHEPNTDKI